jgi:hypothetical protein
MCDLLRQMPCDDGVIDEQCPATCSAAQCAAVVLSNSTVNSTSNSTTNSTAGSNSTATAAATAAAAALNHASVPYFRAKTAAPGSAPLNIATPFIDLDL